jgi:hypothetical protein
VTGLLERVRSLGGAVLARVRPLAKPRERLLATAIAVLAGLVVFLVASDVFQYHSVNHDEGVYLQQADLLLHGQLQMHPGPFESAVRPWFFVDGGDSYYPKYQPLPAGFYAVSMALFGEPRVTLAAIAAGNAALVYTLGSQLFDRRIGVVAIAAFAFAPMTLITTSVFLAYAPTTLCNLAFAVAYLRSYRTGSRVSALLAGLAIGTAFLMRPYTAVLFALPFLVHACWELAAAIRAAGLLSRDAPVTLPDPVVRQALTALLGGVFVLLTLAYNAVLTGSLFVFPYEAFAPLDGPGLGHRRILNHSIDYTLSVAVESNAHVLWYLLTRWVPGGVLGTALAAVGLFVSLRHTGHLPLVSARQLPGDRTGRALLAALFVSVPLGNLFFWGNFNILATPGDPADGLLGQFGPFYHFDLLAPIAIFGAAGAVFLLRSVATDRLLRGVPSGRLGDTLRNSVPSRAATLSVLLALLLVTGGVNAALVAAPMERNAAHTDTYERAYEPFDEQEFEDALVFVPTPYGPWLNHPFQYLRNDADLDGDAVYVMDRGVDETFEMLDVAPDRTPYRYTYRGEWTAAAASRDVTPRLERLTVHEAPSLDADTTVGIPDRVSHAVVRIETENGHVSHTVSDLSDRFTVAWSLNGTHATLDAVGGSPVEGDVVIDSVGDVILTVRLVQSGAGTLTYRQENPVQRTDEGVAAVWPPERTVCPIVDDCGREGTYLPDHPEQHYDGVVFETTIEAAD